MKKVQRKADAWDKGKDNVDNNLDVAKGKVDTSSI